MDVRRWSVAAALALLAAGLAGGAHIWNRNFRVPPVELLPLQAALIALDSPDGQRLLAEPGFKADHAILVRNFESQMRRNYCGVASAVTVLNALRAAGPRLDQASFFTDAASRVLSAWRVSMDGMTLSEFAQLLRAHGADITLHYASATGPDEFRALAQRNLATPGDLLVVNYQRAALGQVRIGHIAPVAAYHAATDRLLVLDVASHRYPSVWVPTLELWRAMALVETPGGHSRGFVVVRAGTDAAELKR